MKLKDRIADSMYKKMVETRPHERGKKLYLLISIQDYNKVLLDLRYGDNSWAMDDQEWGKLTLFGFDVIETPKIEPGDWRVVV